MAKTLFEAIGYALGKKAAQAKNAFDLVGGTEEDSLRAEIRLGRDLAAALLERVPLVEENEPTRFAAQIGRWLAGNVKEKKLPFIVRVTAEREPNALALPGGPIFVSWPLLEMCQGQRDEIAFVLGHEMAHIVRRHTLDRIVKDAALSLLLRQSLRPTCRQRLAEQGGAATAGLVPSPGTTNWRRMFSPWLWSELLAGTHWQGSACWRNSLKGPPGRASASRANTWPPTRRS